MAIILQCEGIKSALNIQDVICQIYLSLRKRLFQRYKEQTSGYQWGEECGKGQDRDGSGKNFKLLRARSIHSFVHSLIHSKIFIWLPDTMFGTEIASCKHWFLPPRVVYSTLSRIAVSSKYVLVRLEENIRASIYFYLASSKK